MQYSVKKRKDKRKEKNIKTEETYLFLCKLNLLMKKILLGIIAVLLIFSVLIFLGAFYPLNKFFASQVPDTSCKIDSDCDIFRLPPDNIYCSEGKDCRMLDFNSTSIIATNKNWRPFCPFPKPLYYAEIMCIGGTRLPQNYKEYIKCIDNQCKKII